MRELDLQLPDGRNLHAYDTGTGGRAERLAVMWHHGTPNIGLPPEPLFPTSERLGIRWVSYDRPGYGGSKRIPAAELWLKHDDGHISVLAYAPDALEWLASWAD